MGGQFLRDEIALPLGIQDAVFCGMHESQQALHHIADMVHFRHKWTAKDPEHKKFAMAGMSMSKLAKEAQNKDGSMVHFQSAANWGVENSAVSRAVEVPSANGLANARSLGKIAAL